MKKNETRKKLKKPYVKPVLRIVNISGGIQTLANGCKFSFGTTAAPSAMPCIANNCARPEVDQRLVAAENQSLRMPASGLQFLKMPRSGYWLKIFCTRLSPKRFQKRR